MKLSTWAYNLAVALVIGILLGVIAILGMEVVLGAVTVMGFFVLGSGWAPLNPKEKKKQFISFAIVFSIPVAWVIYIFYVKSGG